MSGTNLRSVEKIATKPFLKTLSSGIKDNYIKQINADTWKDIKDENEW